VVSDVGLPPKPGPARLTLCGAGGLPP
jgi:hypothetical protein